MSLSDESFEPIEIEYQMQVVETDDPCTLYLACVSDQPMGPAEFAQALMEYAGVILSHLEAKGIDPEQAN